MTDRIAQTSPDWPEFVAAILACGETNRERAEALGFPEPTVRDWLRNGPPSQLQRVSEWPLRRQRRVLAAVRRGVLRQKQTPGESSEA